MLLVVMGVAHWLDPLPEGLLATYYADSQWQSDPVHVATELQPSTDTLVAAWQGNPPPRFSATWAGSLMAWRSGTYTFATTSDDGSWLYIDGHLIVDNGGHHGARTSDGALHLDRGVHSIFVKYFQDGGDLRFALLWARDGQPMTMVPPWILSSRHAGTARTLASVLLRVGLEGAVCLWVGAILILGAATLRPYVVGQARTPAADSTGRALLMVIAGSTALNTIGIWWGLPALWAGDEITPTSVLLSLSHGFTNGWFNRYPPFHFYVLTIVFSPWLVAKHFGWIQLSYQFQDMLLPLLSRLVSVAAGTGTLIAVYACGARAFGRRAGVFAAAMMALLAQFVYYSKTANPEVPYVFWFAVSLVFYLRLLDTGALEDGILFVVAGMLAICTKDQAYALYLSTPAVVVYHFWRLNRARGLPHPLRRAIFNVRLALIGLAATAVFAVVHNIPFNASGFIHHVRDITGIGSEPYRMVEPTLGGRLALVRLTADLNQRSWGWPLWIVSLAGLIVAVGDRRTWRVTAALVLVMVGYYVGFIDTILYVYDRYLLPICVVQALLGGLALDRFLGGRALQGWRVALVTGAFAYTLLYATTVDVLMVRDSRRTTEAWLRARVSPTDLVGTVFPPTVLPRLDEFDTEDLGSIHDLQEAKPAYYVLNADYARAIPVDTGLGQVIQGLQRQTLGYRLVFRCRTASPWPWLPAAHPDLVGARLETQSLSTLRAINPTMEIYERVDVRRPIHP
ncbi:MAG TPA: PA14 domain-containing protein [Vicinamibacterales bacterium]|nr:PA14 domain-containing protein [Vicinamibacterales bacterium]